MDTKLATDTNGNALQVSHPATDDYQNLTTAVQFEVGGTFYLNPVGGTAWIKVATTSPTAADGEGLYVSTPITIKINDGEYLASSASINVVPWEG